MMVRVKDRGKGGSVEGIRGGCGRWRNEVCVDKIYIYRERERKKKKEREREREKERERN